MFNTYCFTGIYFTQRKICKISYFREFIYLFIITLYTHANPLVHVCCQFATHDAIGYVCCQLPQDVATGYVCCCHKMMQHTYAIASS